MKKNFWKNFGELWVFMNMKKVLRLRESELIGLVNKVINEKKEKKGEQRMERKFFHDDIRLTLEYGDQSDIDDAMSLLMDNRETIKFFHLWFCDGFVDFSGINICELPEIEFVGLKGTKSNFEELFDCYDKFGDNFYHIEIPYFKDERISDVPEPRFSMNESDLKRLVKKIIK